MYKLRDYQINLSKKANEILTKHKIVYLAMEVRTGKTLTALKTAELYGAQKVLFLTKKKAISGIYEDYLNFKFDFYIHVKNDESIHKIDEDFDLVIHDEHHRFGAFPKPNKVASIFKAKYGKLPQIFLSGTPFPESYSQVYHQFWCSYYSPFKEYVNFYKWANSFVDKKKKFLGTHEVTDYSVAKYEPIKLIIEHLLIKFTQKEAGFSTNVKEHVLHCDMLPMTYKIINQLKKDKVVEGKEDVILADTGVKLQSKMHQLFSGTCKFESGNSKILDYSKGYFIKKHFANKKIGIFYKFKEELNLLKEVYKDTLTTDLDEFNNSDKNIALQFISGREGISLRNADCLVAYNIDFSATTYFQFKDRLTTKERLENHLYWVFSKNGIEEKIYKSVMNKKDYTLNVFKKDYL